MAKMKDDKVQKISFKNKVHITFCKYKALSRLANFFLILCALTILFAIVKAHGIKKNLSNVEKALLVPFVSIIFVI